MRKVTSKCKGVACACAAVTAEDWVELCSAGSSELSDARAEQFGLPKGPGHGRRSASISMAQLRS